MACRFLWKTRTSCGNDDSITVITQIPEAVKFIIGQTLLDDRSQTLLRLSQTYRMKVTFLKFQQIDGFWLGQNQRLMFVQQTCFKE